MYDMLSNIVREADKLWEIAIIIIV